MQKRIFLAIILSFIVSISSLFSQNKEFKIKVSEDLFKIWDFSKFMGADDKYFYIYSLNNEIKVYNANLEEVNKFTLEYKEEKNDNHYRSAIKSINGKHYYFTLINNKKLNTVKIYAAKINEGKLEPFNLLHTYNLLKGEDLALDNDFVLVDDENNEIAVVYFFKDQTFILDGYWFIRSGVKELNSIVFNESLDVQWERKISIGDERKNVKNYVKDMKLSNNKVIFVSDIIPDDSITKKVDFRFPSTVISIADKHTTKSVLLIKDQFNSEGYITSTIRTENVGIFASIDSTIYIGGLYNKSDETGFYFSTLNMYSLSLNNRFVPFDDEISKFKITLSEEPEKNTYDTNNYFLYKSRNAAHHLYGNGVFTLVTYEKYPNNLIANFDLDGNLKNAKMLSCSDNVEPKYNARNFFAAYYNNKLHVLQREDLKKDGGDSFGQNYKETTYLYRFNNEGEIELKEKAYVGYESTIHMSYILLKNNMLILPIASIRSSAPHITNLGYIELK
jgi:hypothetical protein